MFQINSLSLEINLAGVQIFRFGTDNGLMMNTINFLKLANYRSLDVLELHDIQPFSVFAGSNGSGKSNFFDALEFVSLATRFDGEEALKQHGGFENIQCVNRHGEEATVFEFKIQATLLDIQYQFKLKLDESKEMQETVKSKNLNNLNLSADTTGASSLLKIIEKFFDVKNTKDFLDIRLYRIEPRSSLQNYRSSQDPSKLHHDGHNLPAVLSRLEKDDDIRETIIDWLELIVPGLETVQTQTERLTGTTALAFKEAGRDKWFPAHFISEGTIYLLSLLVAILDRPPVGLTLIEEPERGLHPKAIIQLVQTFRERATLESPIWVTTHNESVIRCLKNNELWLVDKKAGVTQMKPVREYDASHLPLDQAWLCNALNGGLPW